MPIATVLVLLALICCVCWGLAVTILSHAVRWEGFAAACLLGAWLAEARV